MSVRMSAARAKAEACKPLTGNAQSNTLQGTAVLVAAANLMLAEDAAASAPPTVHLGNYDVDVGAIFFGVVSVGMAIFISYLARRRKRIKDEVMAMGIVEFWILTSDGFFYFGF